MGLADRYYMRDGPRHGPLSLTVKLMIVLIAVFALQAINDVYLRTRAELWFALTPLWFYEGWLWQLVTFQFLHGNLLHLALNLLVFWWVGHFVENVIGRRRFLIAFLGCGLVGGLLQGVLMVLFPDHFGSVVVGASAGVSGLFAIFALLERDSIVRVWFVLPVRAISLLWVGGAIALFFTLVPARGEVAHAAHLGGILAGIAWVKLGWHRDYVKLPWENWSIRFRNSPKRERAKNTPFKPAPWSGAKAEDVPLPPEEFISREVDPILDKISEHGIQSLTERERKILEAARSKMAKR